MMNTMHIDRDALQQLRELQEDSAQFFTDENMISGETYWTCVQCLAEAKLAELRGIIEFDFLNR